MIETRSQSQYINTMVFAVVAGIISLMLLLLVMTASTLVQNYSPFIITIEFGLILAIVVAIYNIIRYEAQAHKAAKDSFDSHLDVSTCPDFWTRKGTVCTNTFAPSSDPNVTVKVWGTLDDFTNMVKNSKDDEGNFDQSIDLKNYDNKTILAVCNQVNDPVTGVKGPWTDVRAVCSSYRV